MAFQRISSTSRSFRERDDVFESVMLICGEMGVPTTAIAGGWPFALSSQTHSRREKCRLSAAQCVLEERGPSSKYHFGHRKTILEPCMRVK